MGLVGKVTSPQRPARSYLPATSYPLPTTNEILSLLSAFSLQLSPIIAACGRKTPLSSPAH
ncbi:MAG: hypothetical protein K0B14_18425, partial [Anaerolineaceae bacterium]|nr:hypothetical protein [Anaerolineaceae bacterium]